MKVVKSCSTNSPHSEHAEAYHQVPNNNLNLGHEYDPMSFPATQRHMQYPMGPIVGCTPLQGNNTVFVDTNGPGSAFDVDHDWYAPGSGFNRVQDPLDGPGRSSWDLKKEI
jgi:hypothetical protein